MQALEHTCSELIDEDCSLKVIEGVHPVNPAFDSVTLETSGACTRQQQSVAVSQVHAHFQKRGIQCVLRPGNNKTEGR